MSSPNLEDPVQLLRDDHERVLEVLDAIEEAVVGLQGAESGAARRALREGLDLLERHVRTCTRLEETVLFPAFRSHVAPLTIETLVGEHSDFGWTMDRLAAGLQAGQEAHAAELRWHATVLVDLMRRHIEKENYVLHLIVSKALPDPESAALGRALHEYLRRLEQPS